MAKAPIGGSGSGNKGPVGGKKGDKGYGNRVAPSGKPTGRHPPRKAQGK